MQTRDDHVQDVLGFMSKGVIVSKKVTLSKNTCMFIVGLHPPVLQLWPVGRLSGWLKPRHCRP